MNVLFVGPYRQNDGWGRASREYLRALQTTQYNLASRPIYYTSSNLYKEDEFAYLEQKSLDYDIIIQHCLPPSFKKYGGVKNIGLAFFEATIAHTPWPEKIEILDSLIVSSEYEKTVLRMSNIEQQIDIVPIPHDASIFKSKYECPHIKDDRNTYKFYYIGEYIERKNVEQLILAFFAEFEEYESVELVLKMNMVGASQHMANSTIQNQINKIIQTRGCNKRLKVSVITDYLTNDHLMGLHQKCNCFVNVSHGEGYCIPAANALAFGNALITNCTGPSSLKSPHIFGVGGHFSSCCTYDRPMSYLYKPEDSWIETSTTELRKTMRHVYMNRKPTKSIDSQFVSDYSHESIGERFCEILD